jgi:zeta-carotene isomerase
MMDCCWQNRARSNHSNMKLSLFGMVLSFLLLLTTCNYFHFVIAYHATTTTSIIRNRPIPKRFVPSNNYYHTTITTRSNYDRYKISTVPTTSLSFSSFNNNDKENEPINEAVTTNTNTILPMDATSSLSSLSSSSLSLSSSDRVLIGDDAAYFNLMDQSIMKWIQFTMATSTVLFFIAYIWFLPFGLHGGTIFLQTIQNTFHTNDPTMIVSIMLIIFAIFHSGMAGLRTYVEPIIGARIWRVIFAIISLPLALSCISYFVNHAHDGIQYWNINDYTNSIITSDVIHTLLYSINFISFLFLYPSTFNLLEIAAIDIPQLHLYETGIIRITRHPQAFGQILWCFAHMIYIGTSTTIAACTVLTLHHLFSIYHGDRRLLNKHGIEKFQSIQNQTSIIPFAAIIDGRQQLPNDYYKEFIRLPYAVVIIGTMIAYIAHPYMQAGAALLNW